MRRVVLGLAVGAAVAVPASTANAMQELPVINCGIVSCTYPIERKVEFVSETVNAELADVRECVENTIGAIENVLQGTPQPATCDL